uniref:Protein lin-52 homolog n=1 Tax=Amblyomma maculatum TaxID=34609 RepID=G3MRI8_AMBMU
MSTAKHAHVDPTLRLSTTMPTTRSTCCDAHGKIRSHLDKALVSEEKLDGRLSPELWPEPVPGVREFAALLSPPPNKTTKPKWSLDEDGLVMLQELSSLTAAALLEKVKDLQNLAYQLGIEESREMTRGRFLGILRKDKDTRRK